MQDPPIIRTTDTFIVFYLFILYSVTCLKSCHFAACFTSLWTFISVSSLILHVTSPRLCSNFLFFVTLITHFHTHIQRQTHTSTHVWLEHKRNSDNQAQEPGWEGQRRKGFVRGLQKNKSAHRYLKSKKKIPVNRASSKATRLFLMK